MLHTFDATFNKHFFESEQKVEILIRWCGMRHQIKQASYSFLTLVKLVVFFFTWFIIFKKRCNKQQESIYSLCIVEWGLLFDNSLTNA